MPLSFERRSTSKSRLKVDWIFAEAPAQSGPGTVAAGPLPLDDAVAVVSEDDERPLLLYLEGPADQNNRRDDVWSRFVASDRHLLMVRWFRAVRLPAATALPGHALHNLVAQFAKDQLPQIVVLAHGRAKPMAFAHDAAPSDLRKALGELLTKRYVEDAEHAVRDWLTLLEHFDMLDARQSQLEHQLAEALAAFGPDSAKVIKFQDSLQRNAGDRVAARWRERQIRDLGLVPAP